MKNDKSKWGIVAVGIVFVLGALILIYKNLRKHEKVVGTL